MKRKTQKVYKPLPPHTNEAHPVANAGQASKPFIIAVITIVAVVALTLLLLFSDRLVGKAFYTGEANTAGASLPSPAVEGQPFMVAVKANVGSNPAASVDFELSFPDTFACPQILDLLNWPVKSISCDSNLKTVRYTAITNSPVSGEINVVNLVFPGTSIGSYEFDFVRDLEIKKPTAEVIVLSVQSPFTVEVSAVLPVCGNNILEQGEACDDGNVEDNDGCSAHCEIQDIPVCGDGVIDEIEQCDDGNTITESCAYGSYICNVCDAECNELTLPVSYCGDGNIDLQNEEVCDGQNLGGATCSGLGFAGGGTLLCAQNCKYNATGCSSQGPVCGNGIVNSNEQCDDGNNVTGDGCSSVCQTELQVQYACTDYIPNSHLCTNDDQNLSANTAETIVDTPAGCTPGVKCEGYCFSGYHKAGNSCVANVCGNGLVEAPEQCDDSNNVTGDGCSLACVLEAGWNCSGQPSDCVQTPAELLTTQGTKITLTDEDTGVPALVATKVTATVSFSTEITVYTVLYGPNNKVLSIKSEKIENGLVQGATYLATLNYPMTNVRSKSVIVYDVEQAPTVFGQLQKSYE